MSNKRQNSSPLQRQFPNKTIYVAIGCATSVLSSLGTAFCACFVTAYLFYYYMNDLHGRGLDGGAGMLFIWLLWFPIIFLLSVIMLPVMGWSGVARVPESLKDLVTSWLASLVSLIVGLGTSYTFVLLISNFWKTKSYQEFVNTQTLIWLGFPCFFIVMYFVTYVAIYATAITR